MSESRLKAGSRLFNWITGSQGVESVHRRAALRGTWSFDDKPDATAVRISKVHLSEPRVLSIEC